ncbi:hypothetical protein IMG5_015480 [Ichthyophthirius multifiliis]|uniref:NadR/Ttd14 AAA domain-containing protein n=1 Tax=Ichthyophthirius multifiliis TaxID=5932 RepID=G0QKB1_ICHMU|nr:hypothetical protein IMG5_015480 [Ichthyophthirius multifiliis]EGR34341.1 hypothetical protein IMG5_015480 [Ichthyophthirius multifiliis]|eukprot:XP_004039645.1 hypothetical protein IMG5_015480 [Ichthyophthirius multifiliis]
MSIQSENTKIIKQISLIGCSIASSLIMNFLAQKLLQKKKAFNALKTTLFKEILQQKREQEEYQKHIENEKNNLLKQESVQPIIKKTQSINIENLLTNEQQKNDNQPNEPVKIYKICITGGPCSGKTSGVVLLAEKLRDEGFQVFTVPEAVPLLVNGGGMLDIQNLEENQQIAFYKSLMIEQAQLEDTFLGIAKLNNQNAIVLCERGLMDNSAYLSHHLWQELLNQMNINEFTIRDQRYDCVVHLVTSADGAEDFYNKQNTNGRRESPQEAINLDRKIQLAWFAHSVYFKMENELKFDQKLQQLVQTVRKQVGLPVQLKKFNKRYLIQNEKEFTQIMPKDLKIQKFFIEDNFVKTEINSQDPEYKFYIKIRRRGQESQYTYSWFQSEYRNGKQIGSQKKQLNFKEYLFMLSLCDKARQNLLKERICFMQNGLFYIIDTYENVKEGFSILKVKVQDENQPHVVPNFVKIIRDVTHEKGYRSRILAKKDWYAPEEDEEILNIRKDQYL